MSAMKLSAAALVLAANAAFAADTLLVPPPPAPAPHLAAPSQLALPPVLEPHAAPAPAISAPQWSPLPLQSANPPTVYSNPSVLSPSTVYSAPPVTTYVVPQAPVNSYVPLTAQLPVWTDPPRMPSTMPAGSLHQRYPYYSYRRPWYTPGPASLNATIVW